LFYISHTPCDLFFYNGVVQFPNANAGAEACGLKGCEGWVDGANNAYVEVELYSLDSYAEKFVKSKGPINVLAIDAEGWDFDVLFGASSVLDRTYYLEFEYHMIGMSFMDVHFSSLIYHVPTTFSYLHTIICTVFR